jgi:UDPglucose 6-dehydrogenase
MKISIIGSGTVGLATGKGMAKYGNDVIYTDVNSKLLEKLEAQNYAVERNVDDLINSTEVSFICVPTPTIAGKQDLSLLKSAISTVSNALRKKTGYHLIVIRNTILPQTMHNFVYPLFMQNVGKSFEDNFGLCYNPEFLREDTAFEDFIHPTRIIIGENNEKAGKMLEDLFRPFQAPIIRTGFTEAEMIKYVSNVFLSTKISFFNEIYEICQKLKIDDKIVSKAVALDPRIGSYGVNGGKPFGGKCLPKDLIAYVSFVSELGITPDLLHVVLLINEKMCTQDNIAEWIRMKQ